MELKFKPLESIWKQPTNEVAIESMRQQVIRRYKRRQIMYVVGGLSVLLIGGGLWWYSMNSAPEAPMLEQADLSTPNTIEETEEIVSVENPPAFKIHVIDDCYLYRDAEEAFLSKNWPAAIHAYKTLADLYPQNLSIWFNLALTYHYYGDLEQAGYWYQKILLRNPGHSGANRNLKILKENVIP